MSRPAPTLSADTLKRQRDAANPDASVWVEANAGSGKTRVLTDRVLRLLLRGVQPEEILCLTYTKAAAAEMRSRVSARLARWATAAGDDLDNELYELAGFVPDADERRRARTLFAHALETPGGLKIQTIHAFCESVLHRFPVEAQVPFDFAVIEDFERDSMILRAREGVLADALHGEGAVAAVEFLFDMLSDSQITDAIARALAEMRKLRHVLADAPTAKANLRRLAGLGRSETLQSIRDDVVNGHPFDTPDRDPDNLFSIFLTKDGTARKRLPSDAHHEEAARLEALKQRETAAILVERSNALLDVLGAIATRYEAEKRARSLLDFDDLVEKLGGLLRDPALGPWVQYKLDTGITHILVDESQDTNAEQWEVVKALAAEFFAGAGAVQRPRTIFAVGDGKQSIYSFQGADPSLFVAAGREFGLRAAAAEMAFARQPLITSFRTLPNVLAAVDRTFADPVLARAVLAEFPVQHDTARSDPGGSVTLWPPLQVPGDLPDPSAWPLQAPQALKSAPRQVAERIAREIRSWVDARRPLSQRGVPVQPHDVLILVQSRSALFHELIRALHKEGLPTPGADRLSVTTHIGVLDLMALADVLLNPGDSLQLAALLRSPLFDIPEEALLALAARRDRTPLWDVLMAPTDPAYAAPREKLARWRSRLDFDRPFEFLTQILYAEGGLKAFHARLGAEVDDVFAEFLDLALEHERSPTPSLQGFLADMRARTVSIKRELAETAAGVRVMTVHGAKGLEAPIVILADAASKPTGRQTSKPVHIGVNPPLFVHASAERDHVPQSLDLRDAEADNQRAEYWRKLYVAMTRAEDELYVTGPLTPGTDPARQLEGTWYAAIQQALEPDAERIDTALVFPRTRPAPAPLTETATQAATPPAAFIPKTLPPYRLSPIVRPSSAFVPTAAIHALDAKAELIADAETARRRGIAIHALLQHLGRVPPAERPAVAGKALAVLLPDAPEQHAELAARALSILGNPALAHFFGASSRPEVPFLARATRHGADITLAGRFDRLVVEPDRVILVDFKSDMHAALTAGMVHPAYLTQLGLYALVADQLFPGRRVEAAILWTSLESLLELPRESLAEATRDFTMR